MTTITITRALSKIKTLNAQLDNDLKNNLYISTIPNNLLGTSTHTKLVSDLAASLESFDSKVNMISKLKNLIAESNLSSTISVGSKVMTVTEALARKEYMALYSRLGLSLRKQNNKATEEVTHTNMRIAQAISGNSSEISSKPEIKNEDLEERLALNAKQLQESMGIKIIAGSYESGEDLMDHVKNYHNEFLSEIDYILSEHNAVTMITLED